MAHAPWRWMPRLGPYFCPPRILDRPRYPESVDPSSLVLSASSYSDVSSDWIRFLSRAPVLFYLFFNSFRLQEPTRTWGCVVDDSYIYAPEGRTPARGSMG